VFPPATRIAVPSSTILETTLDPSGKRRLRILKPSAFSIVITLVPQPGGGDMLGFSPPAFGLTQETAEGMRSYPVLVDCEFTPTGTDPDLADYSIWASEVFKTLRNKLADEGPTPTLPTSASPDLEGTAQQTPAIHRRLAPTPTRPPLENPVRGVMEEIPSPWGESIPYSIRITLQTTKTIPSPSIAVTCDAEIERAEAHMGNLGSMSSTLLSHDKRATHIQWMSPPLTPELPWVVIVGSKTPTHCEWRLDSAH
jgi:hypothetical protein